MTMTMKLMIVALGLSSMSADATVQQFGVHPLQQVFKMLNNLKDEVTKDEEAESKAYRKYKTYCDITNGSLTKELSDDDDRKEDLEAEIDDIVQMIGAGMTKIQELTKDTSENDEDIAGLKKKRALANKLFLEEESELEESIDTLTRAYDILEREAAKNPALVQQVAASTSVESMIQSLGLVMEAAGFDAQDRKQLLAMVQDDQKSKEEQPDSKTELEPDYAGQDVGAPNPIEYKNQLKTVVEMVTDLRATGIERLKTLRLNENGTRFRSEQYVAVLEEENEESQRNITWLRASISDAKANKAKKERELKMVMKEIKVNTKAKEDLLSDCAQKASDHAESERGFEEELNTLSKALAILKGSSDAKDKVYGFLQVSSESKVMSRVELGSRQIIGLISQLAKEQHSSTLLQLASQISTVFKLSARLGQDPFVKVRKMITDLISNLKDQMKQEKDDKNQCDDDKKAAQLRIDENQADWEHKSNQLAEVQAEIATALQRSKELGEQMTTNMHQRQALSQGRFEENEEFKKAKSDLELGIQSVQNALVTLREYYEVETPTVSPDQMFESEDLKGAPDAPELHSKSKSKAAPIIEILTVVESDFSKDLAEREQTEADAERAYEKDKEDLLLAYDAAESAKIFEDTTVEASQESVAGLKQDKGQARKMLDTALQYMFDVTSNCAKVPESYESKKARREAEIKGLKRAVDIIETLQASFVQQGSRAARMRRGGFLQ